MSLPLFPCLHLESLSVCLSVCLSVSLSLSLSLSLSPRPEDSLLVTVNPAQITRSLCAQRRAARAPWRHGPFLDRKCAVKRTPSSNDGVAMTSKLSKLEVFCDVSVALMTMVEDVYIRNQCSSGFVWRYLEMSVKVTLSWGTVRRPVFVRIMGENCHSNYMYTSTVLLAKMAKPKSEHEARFSSKLMLQNKGQETCHWSVVAEEKYSLHVEVKS